MEADEKHSRRIQQKENYAKKQARIARKYGMTVKSVKHSKRSIMDCGTPRCPLCGNRRRVFGELTNQENKLYQNVEDF